MRAARWAMRAARWVVLIGTPPLAVLHGGDGDALRVMADVFFFSMMVVGRKYLC